MSLLSELQARVAGKGACRLGKLMCRLTLASICAHTTRSRSSRSRSSWHPAPEVAGTPLAAGHGDVEFPVNAFPPARPFVLVT